MPNSSGNFIKSTTLSGLLLLVPLMIIIIVMARVIQWVQKIILPIASKFTDKDIAGTGIPLIAAILLVAICCFIAGLFAKTTSAKQLVNWLESNILSNIPGYSFIKATGESMMGVGENNLQEVVFAWIEDSWQLSFVTDRLSNGLIAVYVPGAPSPWSGSLYFMTEEKIKKVNLTTNEALAIIKRIGTGSNKFGQNITV